METTLFYYCYILYLQRQVKSYALDHGLKVYDWPLTPMQDKYDVGVLVSFGHLIPDSIIHMFP